MVQTGVPTFDLVAALQEVQEDLLGCTEIVQAFAGRAFVLERREEPFDERIVPAMPGRLAGVLLPALRVFSLGGLWKWSNP
jgi:hypothetical protein